MSEPSGAPRPVSFVCINGRSPGSRVVTISLPSQISVTGFPSGLTAERPCWQMAHRLQLRGQPRHWTSEMSAPHSLLAPSVAGKGPCLRQVSVVPMNCQCRKGDCPCGEIVYSDEAYGARKGFRGNAVRRISRQTRGCPRNCKRKVLIQNGRSVVKPLGNPATDSLGRRVGASDPRARRPAGGDEHF